MDYIKRLPYRLRRTLEFYLREIVGFIDGRLSTVIAVGTCINAGQGMLQKVQSLSGKVRMSGLGPAEQAAHSGRGGRKKG